MKFIDEIIHKLILHKGFKYYPEDKYFINEILKYWENENAKVLDVGCGVGHYSFLFEECGAKVIAFDYDKNLIKKANERKKQINSNVEFLIANGEYPENIFSGKFDLVFLSGFALFGVELNKELMKKYLSLLSKNGRLIFVHNSNLSGTIRKTNWKNYKIGELKLFFKSLDCIIQKIYFYDRHIIIKIFHSYSFNEYSTIIHCIISNITKLPCCLVFVVKKND